MERVTFLIEETGEQLACLLNPESLVIRRKAGVRARESSSGQLTGSGQTDQPLLFTGGGIMEVELDLLFDVSLAGSSVTTRNVRDLTGPLWNMAENRDDSDYGRPPLTRFIWGKTFNLPGVVVGVAERLERFTKEGIPTRSWLRMRIARVDEDALSSDRSRPSPSPVSLRETAAETPTGEGETHAVSGGIQESTIDGAGINSSITTAADIKTSAFNMSGAGELLTSAQSALSRTVDVLSEGLGRLPEEEDPSAIEQMSTAAESFGQAAESAASGVKNGDLGVVSTAIEQMFAAAGTAAAAAGSLVSEAGREVAGDVRSALGAVGPAAEKLLEAAHRVGQEVVRASARAIGAAVTAADQMVDRASVTAGHLVSAASKARRQAGTALQSGLDTVSEALNRIRTAGELAAVELLPGALQEVSRAADRLWSAGAEKTAELACSMVENMAVTLKNMKAAAEAIHSVTAHSLSGLMQSMSKTLESAVASADEIKDFTGLKTLLSKFQIVGRVVLSAERTVEIDTPEQVQEAVESIEIILETVLESRETEGLHEVHDELPAVEKAVLALETAEQEEVTNAITTAVRGHEESSITERHGPGAGGVGAAGAVQGHQGERLDQIAFRSYGSPAYWRLLALHNDIEDPLRLPTGLQLSIPPTPRAAGP